MTDQLPPPLTPLDADLRDFSFMPLEVFRLRRSKAWLACKRRPDLAFYMLNLWTAAWHERPAGSLEDDDDVLADLAMCSPEKWSKVRDAVLRGWVKCRDGRLYHPVVAEKVVDAWSAKVAQRQRTLRGRIVALERRIRECKDEQKKVLMNQDLLSLSQELSRIQSQNLSPPINKSGQGQSQSLPTETTEAKREGEREGERERQGYIYTGAQATGSVTGGDKTRYPASPPNGDFEFGGELVELTDAEHKAGWLRCREIYPAFTHRQDWITAEHKACLLVTRGEATWDDLFAGTQRYRDYCDNEGVSEPKYVMTPGNFFGAADQPWKQPWPLPPTKAEKRLDKNLAAAEQAKRELLEEEADDAA